MNLFFESVSLYMHSHRFDGNETNCCLDGIAFCDTIVFTSFFVS